MESAVLFLLASSMGVMFGWQPMPDGSPKVEYLVQLEPELVATLQEGQSIPITSDIPDDIGPIGRIRIVVGKDALPRQSLVTRLKPWPGQATTKEQERKGIVETQYTVPPVQPSGGSRYGAQTASNNSQILPPGGGTSVASNPLGRALQRGAQEARNLGNEAKQILPPSDQLFGNARGNVRQAVDEVGDKLKQGVDAVGQRARDTIDQLGRGDTSQRSILNGQPGQNRSTILPLGSSQPGTAQITPRKQRIDQPVDQPSIQPRDQWQRGDANIARTPTIRANPTGRTDLGGQSSVAGQANPTSRSGDFSAPWPEVKTQPAGRYANLDQPPAWQNQQGGRDSFNIANRQPSGDPPPSLGGGQQPSLGSGSEWSGGPQFPTGIATQTGTTQQQADPSWPGGRQGQPEIRRDMMNQPSTMQTVSQQPAVQPVQQQGAPIQQTMGMPNLGNQSYGTGTSGTGPQDLGWNNQNGSDSSGKSLFPLLLSWVLLSGSGAGNLYLFWSYLDVRSKYHGVVHGSSRRDRYDD